ncbi:MAG: class I SAM-dependent methyltransferase, partial [Candidatus Thermoplasmatota archaeon]|nr:class I SAM-dependent methyltransferase [Candidatus Thermoplasmatota archaeon]
EAIKKAKEKINRERLNITLDVGRLESLPYKDGFFDIVYSGYVLHHTNISSSIPEISRVLKTNGIFYCVMFEDIKYQAASKFDESIDRQALFELLEKNFTFIEKPVFDSYDEEDQHGKHSHKRIRVVCKKVEPE